MKTRTRKPAVTAPPGPTKVLVDGRVFSTDAHDRGMGRHVSHIINALRQGGHAVTVLLFRNCHLKPDDPMLSGLGVRFANYDPESAMGSAEVLTAETNSFTHLLSTMIEQDGFAVYVDGTPFLRPCRTSTLACATMSILYDFIPLRHQAEYLGDPGVRRCYFNGLVRVSKADVVVAISRTVAQEAAHYLGIPADRMAVACPTLEDRYMEYRPRAARRRRAKRAPYLFSILGSHKSKNPAGSLRLYQQLLPLRLLDVRVNAPKDSQRAELAAMPNTAGLHLTSSLTDDEKFALQEGAAVVSHLSIEEGFGIPLLEGLFLGRKVIAFDIPINRELLTVAPEECRANVMLMPVGEKLDVRRFREFVATPADPAYAETVRAAFMAHWADAPGILTEAMARAQRHFAAWVADIEFSIFSSVPGTSCGVADYSVAYVRSSRRNVAFFFSAGDELTVAQLPNVRVFTHLDYPGVARTRLAHVPMLYNFAFSEALAPGIDLMRRHGKASDVVLVHERQYFDGLHWMLEADERTDELAMEFSGHTEAERRGTALQLATHPAFNRRLPEGTTRSAPISAEWLRRVPGRKVSHLSPPVMEKMLDLARTGGGVLNDLEEIEDSLEYVPLGIDSRRTTRLVQAARRFRLERGIQQDDVLLGHFGLIVGDWKMLAPLFEALAQALRALSQEDLRGKRVFVVLAGKILDIPMFERLQDVFDELGIPDRLFHDNPLLEHDFETRLAACDAVLCLRKQVRGQLSHIYVRALGLGVPVVVNRDSGYAYDARTVLRDDHLNRDLLRVLHKLLDGREKASLRDAALRHFKDTHTAAASLRAMLEGLRA